MKRLAFLVLALTIINTSSLLFAANNKFGVIIGGKGKLPDIVPTLQDLGVGWIRINNQLDGEGQDIARFLDAGMNVVITISNRNPNNSGSAYGTPQKFPNAGFPFKSKETYKNNIKEVLAPLLPYLKKGRQTMVQCENEIGDAGLNPRARYWRGTVRQYLTQLDFFYETVKALDPAIPVVLSSFTSEGLRNAIRPAQDQRSKYSVKLLTTLLTEGRYDVIDLHFYHCAEDIAAKVQWAKAHAPKGKRWISTENGGPDYRCANTPLHWESDPDRHEKLQARQVSQRLSACTENGGDVCLWFSLMDMRGEADVFSHMGLLSFSVPSGDMKGMIRQKGRKRGGGPLTEEKLEKLKEAVRRKPSYEAFKSFVASHPRR